MNLVETWVRNIISVDRIPHKDGVSYELVCDTNCYGYKQKGITIRVDANAYKSIKEKGYYLT